jgi:hypothetical protein
VQDFSTTVHESNFSNIEDSDNVTSAQGHSFAAADQHFAPQHVDIDHSQLAGDDINDFFHG